MIISSQNLFRSREENREEVEREKFYGFAEENGDFFSLLNIYEDYEKACK